MTTYTNSDGDTYDEAELESFFFDDTASLDAEARAEITFDDWLGEMLSWGRFSVVDDDDS